MHIPLSAAMLQVTDGRLTLSVDLPNLGKRSNFSSFLGLMVIASVMIASVIFVSTSTTTSLARRVAEGTGKWIKTLRSRSERTGSIMRIPSASSSPEPKWYILMYINYALTPLFILSLAHFATDPKSHSSDYESLLPFLAFWSTCVAYFLGFFGISFVDTQALKRSPSAFGLSSISNKPAKPATIHPPAPVAPSCKFPKTPESTKPSAPYPADDVRALPNAAVAGLVLSGSLKDHLLEKVLADCSRAVEVRRLVFDSKISSLGRNNAIDDLPSSPSLDYSKVHGANCEVVVGYVPLPVGIVGPLTLNGESFYIPMATTEGCLVASTNRGCKAITASGGATSTLLKDGITRAPCLRLESAEAAAKLALWVRDPQNFALLKDSFESTTSFGKLLSAEPTVAGRNVYLRLTCFSGDAMGMNMVSKGSLALVDTLTRVFPSCTLVALSGNMCTDKKASAVNWIEGRGKSVVIESTISKDVVDKVLKTSVKAIVSVNMQKNLIGSAMSASIGGFNAHAANNVAAVFLATGQDPAQVVESANCITIMEENKEGDLWVSCTMPSIEVGTVGGGTTLPAQSAALNVMGCKGGRGPFPGSNSQKLAHAVAGTVMAGELSLLAALAANTLVSAHMTHNRKK